MRIPVFFAIFIPILSIILATLLVSYIDKRRPGFSRVKYVYPVMGLGIIIFIIIMTV